MPKKIMILGAGHFQLPAIRKAVEHGLYVITVDYLPNNVGHKYSHKYINCSTVDKEGVLEKAMELEIDGICTFSSDVAVPTMAYVCEKMSLPGISVNAAETMVDKHNFRVFLRDSGLGCPRFVAGKDFAEISGKLGKLKFPVVFKPTDTSGSRGISKIDKLEERSACAAFKAASEFSRSGMVCVEEFVDGTEVGGDGLLVGGRFSFIAITHKHLNGFVVTGHSLPTNISSEDERRVTDVLETCCRKLGYLNGPLNFDVKISPDRVVILELSARTGGNGIPEVIKRSTGTDVELSAILLSLGEDVVFEKPPRQALKAGSFVFGSPTKGVLEKICTKEELFKTIPEIFDVYLMIGQGENVLPFQHSGNMIGYVLFTYDERNSYQLICRRIQEKLGMEVLKEISRMSAVVKEES